MLRPSKRYRTYLEYLKVWWPLAAEVFANLPPSFEPSTALQEPALEQTEELEDDLTEGTDSASDKLRLSVGFVLQSYFKALGQLESFLDAASAEWPDTTARLAQELLRYSPALLPGESDDLRRHLVIRLEVSLWTDFPQAFPESKEGHRDIGYICDLACEFHRLMHFDRGASLYTAAVGMVGIMHESDWRNALLIEVSRLSADERQELAGRMRTYLRNSFVLKSLPPKERRVRENQEFLLSIASEPGETMFNMDVKGLLDEMSGAEIDSALKARVETVLVRLGDLLAEIPLDEIPGILGDWGGARSFSDVNIIPSDSNSSACHSILLAIASGHSKTNSLSGVLREVRRHLIDCFRENQVVIILTDTWDPKKFSESEADILAHRRKGKIFITGVVSGRKVSAVPLPF